MERGKPPAGHYACKITASAVNDGRQPTLTKIAATAQDGIAERLRNNWLFAGSLRAGQRAAAVMSLIQSARLNGHDAYAYLKDILERLPTQSASRIKELLPHSWQPAA